MVHIGHHQVVIGRGVDIAVAGVIKGGELVGYQTERKLLLRGVSEYSDSRETVCENIFFPVVIIVFQDNPVVQFGEVVPVFGDIYPLLALSQEGQQSVAVFLKRQQVVYAIKIKVDGEKRHTAHASCPSQRQGVIAR